MSVLIGYQNLFESASSIAATSEAAGFPKENAYDWLPRDWWLPSAAGTYYLTADMGSATAADYFAVYAHDLADNSASITLQYSTDNFAADTNDAFTAVSPATNLPIFRSFGSQSKRYWRIKVVSAGTASHIGCATFGAALDMGRGPQASGFAPPLSNAFDETNILSNSGLPLARAVSEMPQDWRIQFPNLTSAFVRASWIPFVTHAKTKPFFIQWDNTNYPDEAAFCWTDSGIRPATHPTIHTLMDVELRCRALV